MPSPSRTVHDQPEAVANTTSYALPVRDVLLVAGVVCAASLLGILTRPVGFLAAFWPANAILLGLLVRRPSLSTPWGWSAAFVGYVAADLATGGSLLSTCWLTTGNLAGVSLGYWLFSRLGEEDRRLQRPLSVLYLFAIILAASIAAGIVGTGAVKVLFNRDPLTGMALWFTTEFVNFLVLLPVLLTAPSMKAWRDLLRVPPHTPLPPLRMLAPILALAGSIVLGILLGGPGALAFPVPALLWCALTYSLFTTAFLTMLVSAWLLIGISTSLVHLPLSGEFFHSIVSARLGIALLALGPLTVASIDCARNELMRKLDAAASYDSLTSALARGTFLQRGKWLVDGICGDSKPVTVLMLDIDNFKTINDRHGHAVGDQVLIKFASIVRGMLREGDLFGRLGGEEFAVVLPGISSRNALKIADRIRHEVEKAQILSGQDSVLRVSVSIGGAAPDGAGTSSLDKLLSIADVALYRAKEAGRNRVVMASATA